MAKKKGKKIKKKVEWSSVMEFLEIYGWIILVILIAVGALAYFGVLNPENFLPEEKEMLVSDYEPLCEKYCEDVRKELYGEKCIEVDNESIEVVCNTCTNFVSRRIGVKKSYLESLE